MACLLLVGRSRTIRYARLPGGRACEARDFYESLEPKIKARLQALLEQLAHEGRLTNTEHFEKLEGFDNLWELKGPQRSQVRIFCCQKGNNWVLCQGVIKQQNRLRRSQLETAARICGDDQGNHTREN